MRLESQKVHPAKWVRSWLRARHYEQAIECANVALCALVQGRAEETKLSPPSGHLPRIYTDLRIRLRLLLNTLQLLLPYSTMPHRVIKLRRERLVLVLA